MTKTAWCTSEGNPITSYYYTAGIFQLFNLAVDAFSIAVDLEIVPMTFSGFDLDIVTIQLYANKSVSYANVFKSYLISERTDTTEK